MREQRKALWLQSVNPSGRGLCVEFLHDGQRFAHRLGWMDGHEISWLLQSQEGTDSQVYPPSPACQQLDFQTDTDGNQVALLIGMAGKTHWAVSIEAIANKSSLRFDVAARTPPTADAWIGSTYESLNGSVIQLIGDNPQPAPLRTELAATSNAFAVLLSSISTHSLATLALDRQRLSIRAPHSTPQSTRRWQYQLTVTDESWSAKAAPHGCTAMLIPGL